MGVKENIREVQQKICAALERSGRENEPVKIVAVTKTVSEERILESYKAGHKIFGENKVQEWQRKYTVLPYDCEWHIIGRLQTNKIKYLDPGINLIHSLDRLSLLEKLNAEGEKRQAIWKTLVQVNVAREESKAGLEMEEVKDFMEKVRDYPFVQVFGLMTIGALEASADETRGYFRKLREIRDELIRQGVCKMEEMLDLSMGMSQDYELAVEEGATIVRIGSSIFGHRN